MSDASYEWVGVPLSLLAGAALAYTLVHLWRHRAAVPPLQYGRARLSAPTMALVWAGALVWSLVSGVGAMVLTSTTEATNDRGRLQVTWGGEPVEIRGGFNGPWPAEARAWSLGLPFYRYSTGHVRFEDGAEGFGRSEAVVLPVGFLIGLFAYWYAIGRTREGGSDEADSDAARGMERPHSA